MRTGDSSSGSIHACVATTTMGSFSKNTHSRLSCLNGVRTMAISIMPRMSASIMV